MTHILFGTDMFLKQIYIGLSEVIIIATFLNTIIVSKLSTNCKKCYSTRLYKFAYKNLQNTYRKRPKMYCRY